MDQFLSVVSREPISVISIALALTSITVAYLLYRRSRRTKDPCWAIRNTTLVEGYGSKLEALTIQYKGDRVEDLSVSRIAFWNDGKATIDRRDIETANPLRITSKGEARILDAKVLVTNSRSSEFGVSLRQDGTAARLDFDYLDQGHGAVLQVVHTGTSFEDLDVVGDIKGAPAVRYKRIKVPRYVPAPMPVYFAARVKPAIARRLSASIMLLAGLYLGVHGAVAALLGLESTIDWLGVLADFGGLVVLTSAGVLILRARPPSGLEALEEEVLE